MRLGVFLVDKMRTGAVQRKGKERKREWKGRKHEIWESARKKRKRKKRRKKRKTGKRKEFRIFPPFFSETDL